MKLLGDLIACSLAVGIVYGLIYVIDKIRNRWTLVSIFINPKTGISYEVKERNGKFRFYVCGIRVPEKLYDWLKQWKEPIMWKFRKKKRFDKINIVETKNNILMPINQELYRRIEEEALREIREAKEASSGKENEEAWTPNEKRVQSVDWIVLILMLGIWATFGLTHNLKNPLVAAVWFLLIFPIFLISQPIAIIIVYWLASKASKNNLAK
jgi:hypothetical protein